MPSVDAAGSPPSDVWVDDRVLVRQSSIEGRGLVANAAIPEGTIVMRFGGQLVSTSELERLIASTEVDPTAPYVDTLTVEEDRHLVLPPGTTAHFANHSCDPNLWHVGPYEVATRKDISAGDELTIDYATDSGAPGFSMECACGSILCRGAVSSDDWRLPELQRRYRDHWVPALQHRIETAREA